MWGFYRNHYFVIFWITTQLIYFFAAMLTGCSLNLFKSLTNKKHVPTIVIFFMQKKKSGFGAFLIPLVTLTAMIFEQFRTIFQLARPV